jgi:phosphoribosylformylglycinamidine synthase
MRAHVHWVWSAAPLRPGERDKLAALLRYGDPYAGPADGALIVVAPRLGTVSPWASKATDIAHNCGLASSASSASPSTGSALKSGLLGRRQAAGRRRAAGARGRCCTTA